MLSSSHSDGDDQRANPNPTAAGDFASSSAGHSDRHPADHAQPQPHPLPTPREQQQQGEPELALRTFAVIDDHKDDPAGAVELAPMAAAPISSPAATGPRPVVVHLAEPVVASAAEAEQKQQPAAPLDVMVDVDPSASASSPAGSPREAAEPGAPIAVGSKSEREATEFAALAASLKGSLPRGLTDTEAADRLLKYGRNEITEKEKNPLLEFCLFFWGPLAWAIGQPHRHENSPDAFDGRICVAVSSGTVESVWL